MKQRLVNLVVMLTITVTLVACGNAPQRWKQTALTFETTEKALDMTHDAGLVSDDDLIAVQPYLQAGKGALDQAFQHIAVRRFHDERGQRPERTGG